LQGSWTTVAKADHDAILDLVREAKLPLVHGVFVSDTASTSEFGVGNEPSSHSPNKENESGFGAFGPGVISRRALALVDADTAADVAG
jgi:hypothetical protein